MVGIRGRPPEGVWHHAINRGPSGAIVFREPADALAFLRLLGELERRFRVEVHAYCVMGSHYHLLARAPEPLVRRAVEHVERGLGRRLREGGLPGATPFPGPFRLLPVRAERHALHVTRYLHLNPVAAGLATRAEDWPWSSYRGYLNPPEGPAWLHTRTLLSRFGAIGAHRRYREFVESDAARGPFPLPRVPLPVIERVVGEVFALPPGALRVGTGGGRARIVIARGALVLAAREIGGWPLADIAGWLGYASLAGAARAAARFREAAATDPELLRRFTAVLEDLAT